MTRLTSKLIVPVYILAGLWLTGSIGYATQIHFQPAPVIQLASDHGQPMVTQTDIFPGALVPLDPASIRDPFSKGSLSEVTKQFNKGAGPTGYTLKALILSVKKGAVLEDAAGGIYFFSEGESINGLMVRSITETSVSVEVNGSLMELSIGS